MKYLRIIIVTFIIGWLLIGCGSEEETAGDMPASASKIVEASIEGASFILPGSDSGYSDSSSETALLAVDLQVKNVSEAMIFVSSYGQVHLYDGDRQLQPHNISNYHIDFRPRDSGEIAAGKIQDLTVVFEVEPGKEYEIALHPQTPEFESEEVTIPLNTLDYMESYERLDEPEQALIALIDTVFYDNENSDYEKLVSADKDALQAEALKVFRDKLNHMFLYANVSEDEAKELYESYRALAGERNEFEVRVDANADGKAHLYVSYNVLSLDELSNVINDYKGEYRENKGGFDPEAEEECALSEFDSMLHELELVSSERDAEIFMEKNEDGNWTFDPSDDFNQRFIRILSTGSEY